MAGGRDSLETSPKFKSENLKTGFLDVRQDDGVISRVHLFTTGSGFNAIMTEESRYKSTDT